MATPTVHDRITSGTTSAQNFTIDLPANVAAGNLLLLVIGNQHPNGDNNPPTITGWTNVADGVASSFAMAAVLAKVADGSEGGTQVTAVQSAASPAAAVCYQISAWEGTIAAGLDENNNGRTLDTGGSSTVPVPGITPAWGAADTLWIALAGLMNDDGTATAAPTNYGNLVSAVSGGGVDAGASAITADRELNATSDDPDSFTLSESEVYVCFMVAVQPGTAGSAPSTGPSISSAPDTIVRTGTGYQVDGSGFGATQGTGTVELETSDGTTVEAQTVTAWSDTQITFDAVPGALPIGSTDLVLRVTTDAAEEDTHSPVTLRHPQVTLPCEDDAGTALGGETGIVWQVFSNLASAPDDTGTDDADVAGDLTVDLPTTAAAPGDTVVMTAQRTSGERAIDDATVT